MAEPFATVDDLEGRWRLLSTEEQDQATLLLGDASTILRSEIPDIDVRLAATPPTLDVELPKLIVCAMVKRAMLAGTDVDGVASAQQTVGPFTQSSTYANPLGNLYTTKAERRLLGSTGQRAFTVDPTPPAVTVADPWTW
jgi:hypothetical protein